MKKIKLWHFPLIMILFVSALFFVPMEDVHASDRSYVLPYNEPMADDKNGYLVIEYYNPTRGYFVETFMWCTYVHEKGVDTSNLADDCYTFLTVNSDSFNISVHGPSFSDISGFISYYDYLGQYVILNSYVYSGSDNFYGSYNPSSPNVITGFTFKGNVASITTDLDAPEISVTFANNGATQLNINEIIYQLTRLNEDTDELIQQIVNIYNDTNSIRRTLTNINTQIVHYLPQYLRQNEDIIELLEKIEAYLAYPDNGSGEKVEDFGSSIGSGNLIIEDKDQEVEDNMYTDEYGVSGDDYSAHGSSVLDVLDSITSKSMDVYYDILDMITDYPIVTTMILIVFVFAFCGFIFFGRR